MAPDIAPPVDRAIAVVRANRYLVLATVDQRGPWAAAVSFVSAAPNRLYFVSRDWSRHGKAIREDGRVAGVIYDSRAAMEDVESVQFEGVCIELRGNEEETRLVLERGAIRDKGAIPTADDVKQLANSADQRLYRVEIRESFVLDQQAWFTRGVDAREPVDIAAVLGAFEQVYRAGL